MSNHYHQECVTTIELKIRKKASMLKHMNQVFLICHKLESASENLLKVNGFLRKFLKRDPFFGSGWRVAHFLLCICSVPR